MEQDEFDGIIQAVQRAGNYLGDTDWSDRFVRELEEQWPFDIEEIQKQMLDDFPEELLENDEERQDRIQKALNSFFKKQ